MPCGQSESNIPRGHGIKPVYSVAFVEWSMHYPSQRWCTACGLLMIFIFPPIFLWNLNDNGIVWWQTLSSSASTLLTASSQPFRQPRWAKLFRLQTCYTPVVLFSNQAIPPFFTLLIQLILCASYLKWIHDSYPSHCPSSLQTHLKLQLHCKALKRINKGYRSLLII